MKPEKVLIGMSRDNKKEELILAMANRHGLITGATGTGKTVTLQRITEQFSSAGIPVFTADIKGDLAGLAFTGVNNEKIMGQLKKLKINRYTPQKNPVIFWDLYGKNGHPLRTTVSEMGPILLGRVLEANAVQQGVLNAAFSLADDQGLLLIDLKDLQTLLEWIVDQGNDLDTKYGRVSRSSIGALQRGVLTLLEAGGDKFFGEPALRLDDLMRKDSNGKGYISILDATQLIQDARLYSTFLLWLLSELFEKLPEVGDLDKPKLVFFFDEAHLLFNSAPKNLIDKIEQMVRLVRSKGVGVYFVTQNPLDVPETVLGQLGNRVQHALRAFTPKDQKAVKVAAQTFRQNKKLNTEKAITELKVGEALVSFLDNHGSPTRVDIAYIVPPYSRIGTITVGERKEIIASSPLNGFYEQLVNRESAEEMLKNKIEERKQLPPEERIRVQKPRAPRGRPRQSVGEVFIKSTARTLGSKLGQQIIRGVLGSIFGGKK